MTAPLQWSSSYVATGDEVAAFVSDVVGANSRPVLLVLGKGFDPRMNELVKILASGGRTDQLSIFCILIGQHGGTHDEVLMKAAERNWKEFAEVIPTTCEVKEIDLRISAEDLQILGSSGPDATARWARELGVPENADLIVDISALPRGIYFPMIETFLEERGEEFKRNTVGLYVFVAENASLDQRIKERELQEDAYLVPPFRAALQATDDERPLLWFPLLGHDQSQQLERVEKLIHSGGEQREVCPVLPMPSRNPRQADNLIREYSELLQDTWRIDARAFIYASEQNPFNVYKQIVETAVRYNDALEEFEGCRVLISAHSSKLLSLGALLAANELKKQGLDVGLANVDATSYQYSQEESRDVVEKKYFLIALAGEVYDV